MSHEQTRGHRVVLTFDDGVTAKLLCPASGCTPATICAACGAACGDAGSNPCYDCPDPNSTECWVKGWFDNCTADELLRGSVTVEVDTEWNGDHMIAHIANAVQEDS